jgi:hypothetical protein
MNLKTKNEGLWDRLNAHGSGIKTAAKNLAGATKSIATGTPINTTNVQQQKIKSLYARFEKDVDKNLSTVKSNTKNMSSKIQSDITLKQTFLEFLKDLSKILGVSDVNQAIGYIKKYPTTYPKIKSVLDSILASYNVKLGQGGSGYKRSQRAVKKSSASKSTSANNNKKSSGSAATSSAATSSAPLPNVAPKAASPAPTTVTIPNGATIKSKSGKILTFDGTVWKQPNGIPLQATQSSLVSKKYLNQAKNTSPATIPESKTNNITYKEFFV